MCAKNHVDPTAALYQRTVPSPRKSVVASRVDGRIGSRPKDQKAIPTTSAVMTAQMSCAFVASPQAATNGTSTRAGSGGNGRSPRPVSRPAASSTGMTSW
ncbi:MAG: hypothetical protein WCH74_03585 [Chloroflexota bacterium]